MNAFTVRNLPPELARVIRQKAKKEKASLNRNHVILRFGVGPRARPTG